MPDLTTLLSNFLTTLYAGATAGKTLVAQGVGVAPGWSSVRPTGALYWEYTNLANAADTNWVSTTPYSIPAGTLARDGDELLIEMVFTYSAAVSTKSTAINLGYTAWSAAGGFTGGNNVAANGTASASACIQATAIVRRLSATSGSYIYTYRWLGANTVQGATAFTTLTLTWANAQPILAAAKDGTGNAAAVTINDFRITYRPGV